MTEPALLGINQFKFIQETNTIAKTLYRGDESTGYFVMEHEGSSYQVPAAKKFIILHVTTVMGHTNAVFKSTQYYKHTSPSVAGGTELMNYNTPLDDMPVWDFDTYIVIDAGDYINTNHGSAYYREIMLGIECDA
tara:strand:- start:126 stop:530 length:405 start_codon:yes stop_codon:yes gene_type:complete